LVQDCTCGRFHTVTFETVSLFFSYIYLLIPSYRGPTGEPPFFQTCVFFAVPSNAFMNSQVADFVLWVILEFWYEFIQTNSYNCYTNCIVRIRTWCGFCINSYNCYANYSTNSYTVWFLYQFIQIYIRIIVRIHTRCDFFILFSKSACASREE
jgi:hypothetical protein